MKIVNSIISKSFENALLIQKEKIARHTFHLKLKLSTPFVNYSSGQQLRVFVGLENVFAFNDLVRTYSVWHYDPDKLEVDMAVCTFSNGQGSKWASEIAVGDTVYFSGPKGKFIFNPSGQHHIFIGDISALASFYEIARKIEPNKKVWSFICSSNEADFFKDKFSEVHFNVLQSGKSSSALIVENLQDLVLETHHTLVYIAGEANFCKEINTYFRQEKNITSKNMYTKPFWHPEKKGLE